MRHICILFCVCLFFSCSSNKTSEQALFTEVAIDEKGQDVQTTELFDQIDSVYLLKLHTNDQFFLKTITDVRVTEDRIYVYDGAGLYVYDTNGMPMFSVGRVGRGPGEYMRIQDFIITSEHIILYDGQIGNLITYDINGNFQHQTSVFTEGIGLINDTTLIYHDGCGNLSVKNLKGETLRDFSLDFKGIDDVHPSFFSYQNKNINFIDKINQCVYRVTPDSLIPYRHITLGGWQIPSDYFEQFRGIEPQNMYTNVFQKTSFNTNYGLLAYYMENDTWEYFAFRVKMLPRLVYRHKESGKTYLLAFPLWKEDYDKGFQALGMGGAIGTKDDFFVSTVDQEHFSSFMETDQIKNPMLIRLKERIQKQKITISDESNELLLFYRLKSPVVNNTYTN